MPYIMILLACCFWNLPAAEFDQRLRDLWLQERTEIQGEMAIARADELRLYPGEGEPAIPVADPHALVWATDRHPTDVLYRRTGALLAALAPDLAPALAEEFRVALSALKPGASGDDDQAFLRLCALRRRIALSNPLLDFEQLIYAKGSGGWTGGLYHTAPYMGFGQQTRANDRRNGKGYNKWSAEDWQGDFDFSKPEGIEELGGNRRAPGLFVAENWRQGASEMRPLLVDATIANGDHAGKPINGFDGEYHFAFDLSYDGQEVLFARQLGRTAPTHIFRSRVDGEQVQQLTDSWFPDWEPAFLPDDRVVFISLRRWVAARCQSFMPQPCGTLFSMAGDGSDLYPISWHETSEMFPIVTNDGRLVYSRWDYIDRGTVIAHNLWTCYPDGRDPRAPHGNYGQPNLPISNPDHRALVAWAHGKESLAVLDNVKKSSSQVIARPMSEYHIRPLPGEMGRYVGIASIHHGGGYGVPILIDTNIADDGMMSQVRIIKGDRIPAEFGQGDLRYFPPEMRWVTPWPLDERFFLASRLRAAARNGMEGDGIFLLDRFGNSVLLVDDAGVSARPLRARPTPPIIPTKTWQGERAGSAGHKRATISVLDVYRSDLPWPEGVEITALRIQQIVSVPWGGYCQNQITGNLSEREPNPFSMGARFPYSRSCMRAVLGTVPVEKDGSAYFEAPVGKQLIFQALDQNGMAVQSMRSGTYVHPGEQLSCVGCHRTDSRTPPAISKPPLALQRPPSQIQPEPEGSLPLNYHILVKPVLERSCIPCHQREGKGFTTTDMRKTFDSWVHQVAGVGAYDRTDTIPGEVGARASKLGQLLLTTHKDRVSAEDKRRIIVWLDANALEIGALHHQPEQRAGQVVWPLLDMDPENPTGVEHDRPLP